jgi:hypothetical protein
MPDDQEERQEAAQEQVHNAPRSRSLSLPGQQHLARSVKAEILPPRVPPPQGFHKTADIFEPYQDVSTCPPSPRDVYVNRARVSPGTFDIRLELGYGEIESSETRCFVMAPEFAKTLRDMLDNALAAHRGTGTPLGRDGKPIKPAGGPGSSVPGRPKPGVKSHELTSPPSP